MSLSPDKILAKWFPVIGYKNKELVARFVRQLISYAKTSDILKLIQPIEKIPQIDTTAEKAELYASGAACYIVGTLLYLSHYNTISIEISNKMIDFVMCYLWVDFILDQPKEEFTDSLKFIIKVKDIIISDLNNLRHGRELDSELAEYHPVFKAYRKIVNGELRLVKAFYTLLVSELKSVKIQSNHNLPRDEYLKICQEKGENTSILIAEVLGVPVNPQIKLLGYICQIVDDIIDIQDDLNEEIQTVATYDYLNDGNVDKLYIHAFELLDSLDPTYNLLRYAFMLLLGYHSSKPDNALSKELSKKVKPYVYLDYRYTLKLNEVIAALIS